MPAFRSRQTLAAQRQSHGILASVESGERPAGFQADVRKAIRPKLAGGAGQ